MRRSVIKGIPVSPGIAIGPGFVSDTAAIKVPVYRIGPHQIDSELKRFHVALEDSKRQILDLRQAIEEKLGPRDAMIFTVHLQLLQDSSLAEKVEDKVRQELLNIEAAIREVISWYSVQIQGLNDGVMGDKSADIRDVGNRIIRNLLAHEKCHLFARTSSFILVTHEFFPSDTAHIDTSKLSAIVTEVGGHGLPRGHPGPVLRDPRRDGRDHQGSAPQPGRGHRGRSRGDAHRQSQQGR